MTSEHLIILLLFLLLGAAGLIVDKLTKACRLLERIAHGPDHIVDQMNLRAQELMWERRDRKVGR